MSPQKIGISFIVLGILVIPAFVFATGSNNDDDLTCRPSHQTVYEGEEAEFTASGGSSNSYKWTAEGRTYSNEGRTFTTDFNESGTQEVKVKNGSDTAYCTVRVLSSGYYDQNYYSNSNYYSNQNYQGLGNTPNVALTVVSLPNTGFEPQSFASIAFALIVLLGIGYGVSPYVRKAFTAVLR
ncbi:hypothetical protein H7X87_03305 [Acetobacteraceae bacterium]|nr:hypothetical protein [Candidatus Parcubacteria bacterium]